MAIYLSRKKGGTVATPITPSNSSPAQMTANVAVNPTANGYAIESYTDLVPASYSKPVYQNRIYKMVDDGFVVDEVLGAKASDSNPPKLDYMGVYTPYPTDGYLCENAPTSVTPSNANPVHISNLELFYSTLNGTLIDELTNITPSDSSPVTLSSGSIYKMSGAGKAVASVTDKTPSDSSPASVSSGAIIKASASGYLYSSSGLGQYVNITNAASKDENFTLSSGSSKSISVSQKPKLVIWFSGNYGSSVSPGYGESGVYDGQNNRYRRVIFYSSGANTGTDKGDMDSISSSTIVFKNNGSTYRRYHVMMWY